MKSVEQHGTPLATYSGVGDVRFTDSGTVMQSRGCFEAAQVSSGRVVVSFIPDDPISVSKTGDGDDLDDGIYFIGKDIDGWSIETCEVVLYAREPWLIARMTKHPYELSFHPLRLSARRDGVSDGRYSRVRFLISNFLWHGRSRGYPESIRVNAPGFSAVVEPVGDYREVAQRLVGAQGIEPTAYVSVERMTGVPVHLDEFIEFVESLVYLLRLVTGNQVNWYFAEASDDSTGEVFERIYNYALAAPYSNTVMFSPLRTGHVNDVPKVDFPGLSEAFFESCDAVVDRHALRSLIDYFTNACDDRTYLELRGLMASSLTELLVAKYADSKGYSEVVPEGQFVTDMLPVMKSAMEDTRLPKDLRDHVVNYLRGGFRRSFRSRLRLLVADFGLPLEERDLGRIVCIRNSLVHRGAYPSTFDDGGWLSDYRLVTWTNFSILCRLIGYEGDLPWDREGRHLEI